MNKRQAHIATVDYYQRTYQVWYRRFCHLYDPFLKMAFFILNGGFGGELRGRQTIVDWVDPRPGQKIIDICCGTGTLTLLLARRAARRWPVVGLEISAAQLGVARKKYRPARVLFLQGDAQAMPFSQGSFDKGVICGALHELPHDVRQRVLAEAHRVIRAGGRLVVVEHNDPSKRWKRALFRSLERFNPEYPTYRDLLQRGLFSEIERSGWRIARKEVTNWEFFQIVLARRVP